MHIRKGAHIMNPIERLNLYQSVYTKSDKIILKYIQTSMPEIKNASIIEFAEKAGVSKSALLRFCKRIGYKGYSEFKYDILNYLTHTSGQSGDISVTACDAAQIYAECIRQIPSALSQSTMTKAAELIRSAKRIRIYGCGYSGVNAIYFSRRLRDVSIDSQPVTDTSQYDSKADFADENSLYIFITESGLQVDFLRVFEPVQSKKAKTMILTFNSKVKYRDDTDCLICPSEPDTSTDYLISGHVIITTVIDLLINEINKQKAE